MIKYFYLVLIFFSCKNIEQEKFSDSEFIVSILIQNYNSEAELSGFSNLKYISILDTNVYLSDFDFLKFIKKNTSELVYKEFLEKKDGISSSIEFVISDYFKKKFKVEVDKIPLINVKNNNNFVKDLNVLYLSKPFFYSDNSKAIMLVYYLSDGILLTSSFCVFGKNSNGSWSIINQQNAILN
ncbi:MAG: hypothetical protein ACK4RM_00720 [Flavobacterium sp.]